VGVYNVTSSAIYRRRAEQKRWLTYKRHLEAQHGMGSIGAGRGPVPPHLSELHNNKQLLRLAVALDVTPLKGGKERELFLHLISALSLLLWCFCFLQSRARTDSAFLVTPPSPMIPLPSLPL